jgi:hypothetical protein
MTSTAKTNSYCLVSLICAVLSITATGFAQPPSHGPTNGYLLITGGATEPRDYQRFVDLAGGKNANIVVIPNGSVTKPSDQASLQGSIDGVVTRTRATVTHLTWDFSTKKIDVTISSPVDQTIKLFVRRGIESISAPPGTLVKAVKPGSLECNVRLSKLQPVTLHFSVRDEGRSK